MDDDDSRIRSMKFSVIFSRAQLFLKSLLVMRLMASSAVLIVKNRGIQVLAFSQDRKVISTLVLEALVESSMSSNGFAIQFDLDTWIEHLRNPVFELQPLATWMRIFKMSDCSDIHCRVEQDAVPVKLSEAIFTQEHGIDIKSLQKHSVALILRRELFTQVMNTFGFTDSHVLMTIFEDKVSFSRSGAILTYETQNGGCFIRGVRPSTSGYLLIEWRDPNWLFNAAKLARGGVLICTLTAEEWMDWILFNFITDANNFFAIMMEGSDAQIIDP